MGAGKLYTQDEIIALARVKMANPGKQLGPVWWQDQARMNKLPDILMARMREGGDPSKYLARHEDKINTVITELVLANQVRGRSKQKNVTITSCYILAVDVIKMDVSNIAEPPVQRLRVRGRYY